jgi:hypothetical protein
LLGIWEKDEWKKGATERERERREREREREVIYVTLVKS